ncbi:MAG: hypothetical protein HYY84_02585 [Deltaproteobacteria bacterium]|nr:hypothetical protein [Deltaproteobacteria bacterium]
MLFVFWGLAGILGLMSLVFGLMILVHAFQKSTGHGLLCLFVPLYIFYYAFACYDHPKRKFRIGGWLTATAVSAVMAVLAMQQAVSVGLDFAERMSTSAPEVEKQLREAFKAGLKDISARAVPPR